MIRPLRTLIYLGWHGNGNFGDDLMRDVWSSLLPNGTHLVDAPLTRRDYWDRRRAVLNTLLRLGFERRALLLGGGTAIGFANWAHHVERASRVFGARRVVIAGAGSAARDDDYLTSLQPQDWHLWRRLGPRAMLLGVRGPITEREVQANWRPTRVIGDPALALAYASSHWRPFVTRRNAIGVSLGSQEGTRFDIAEIALAVRQLRNQLEVESVEIHQLAGSDRDICTRLASMIGDGASLVPYDGNPWQTVANIAGLRLFVSERLHGAVAGVATGTPTVMLSYASKSDDFWRSVSEDEPVRPSDDAQSLINAAADALDPRKHAAVEAASMRLAAEFLAAVAPLLGARSESVPSDARVP
ncbi:polysaccharide pyruvyl transferase family protein [Agromyces bauzanensis]